VAILSSVRGASALIPNSVRFATLRRKCDCAPLSLRQARMYRALGEWASTRHGNGEYGTAGCSCQGSDAFGSLIAITLARPDTGSLSTSVCLAKKAVARIGPPVSMLRRPRSAVEADAAAKKRPYRSRASSSSNLPRRRDKIDRCGKPTPGAEDGTLVSGSGPKVRSTAQICFAE